MLLTRGEGVSVWKISDARLGEGTFSEVYPAKEVDSGHKACSTESSADSRRGSLRLASAQVALKIGKDSSSSQLLSVELKASACSRSEVPAAERNLCRRWRRCRAPTTFAVSSAPEGTAAQTARRASTSSCRHAALSVAVGPAAEATLSPQRVGRTLAELRKEADPPRFSWDTARAVRPGGSATMDGVLTARTDEPQTGVHMIYALEHLHSRGRVAPLALNGRR